MYAMLSIAAAIALPQQRVVDLGIRPELIEAVKTVAIKQLEIWPLFRDFSDPVNQDLEAGRKLVTMAFEPFGDRDLLDGREVKLDISVAFQWVLCRTGFNAIQVAVADANGAGKPLAGEDLLRVLISPQFLDPPPPGVCPPVEAAWKEWLEVECGATLEDWEQLKESHHTRQPMVWLPNIAYVMFGAIHTPEFWKTPTARAEFIESLLGAAASATVFECIAPSVEIALRQALYDVKEKGGARTCCLPPFTPDGKVGFTQQHLDFTLGLIETSAKELMFTADDLRHLPRFMGKMALRISEELSPGSAASAVALATMPATALELLFAHYDELFAQRGWEAYWHDTKRDVEALLADRFPHRLDAQIAALKARVAANPENGSLQQELSELEWQRRTELSALISHATSLYAGADGAPTADVRAELIRLDGFLAEKIASLRAELAAAADPSEVQKELDRLLCLQDESRGEAFRNSWINVCGRDRRWGVDALLEHLAKKNLPAHAVMAAIAWLHTSVASDPQAADAQAVEALFKVGMVGNTEERFCAMAAAELFTPDQVGSLCDATIATVEEIVRRAAPGASLASDDHKSWVMLMGATIEMLYRRRQDPWVTQALAETFDRDGRSLWRGESGFIDGSGRDAQGVIELHWVASSLDENTYQRLKQRGLLPARIIEIRESPPVKPAK